LPSSEPSNEKTETPIERVDQPVDFLPLPLGVANHAAEGTRVAHRGLRLLARQRGVKFDERQVDLRAALREQAAVVLGLSSFGRFGSRGLAGARRRSRHRHNLTPL